MTVKAQTVTDWRSSKRARRLRQYHDRMTAGSCLRDDPATVQAWLAAVERDDRADPYSRNIRPAGGAL